MDINQAEPMRPHRDGEAHRANTSSKRKNLLGMMIETGDDFIDSKQLRAHFPRSNSSIVEHHSIYSDPTRGIRSERRVARWQRQRELGRGGFGTVQLEAERGGALRAVKQIPKSVSGFNTVDHLREILAMAKLSGVCCIRNLVGPSSIF